VVRPQAADPRLVYEALWRDSVVVALPRHHPLTRRTVVDVSELETELFVLLAPETVGTLYDQVFALCQRAGFTPRVAHRVPDLHAAIALVAAGLGIGPVPAAIQALKRKGVVYRPLRPHTRMDIGLAWRRDDESALVQQFRRVARETAARAER
jgi:DNA-binding transcriptional LysR family regulator